jgi:hypothetical protein
MYWLGICSFGDPLKHFRAKTMSSETLFLGLPDCRIDDNFRSLVIPID